MEKCAQLILQLPSELVVARGNCTLRSRAPCIWQFLFAVWVYSSWRNAWFNSGYMLCVSSWCFWKVFFVKVNSNLEVDSRPALLTEASQFGEVCTVSASGCLSCYTLKYGHYFHEARVSGSRLLIVSVLRQKSFSCVRHRRGCEVAGSLDSQVTRHQLVSETHCSVVVPCGHTHRSTKPASKTTTTTAATTTRRTRRTTKTTHNNHNNHRRLSQAHPFLLCLHLS